MQTLHYSETQNYEKIIQVILHEKLNGFDFLQPDQQDILFDCYNNYAEERYKIIRFLNHFFLPARAQDNTAESKQSSLSTSIIQEKETHEQILTKINDKFKGSIVLSSAASRKKIITLLVQFLSVDEYAKLNKSLMPKGLYAQDINDPILIKTIKSLLNSLLRLKKF